MGDRGLSSSPRIYVIAGEASGDLHGSNLIAALRRVLPDIDFYGVGGDRIRESGAKRFVDLAHFHVTGHTDAIKRLPDYWRASKRIVADITEVRPDLVVLIDNPGFNLHLAAKIHALGIPIVYYIAPQVWAWGQERIHKIRRYVKKVLVVFDFEKKVYEDHGIPVVWVGHPLKDLLSGLSSASAKPLQVCLLPGSRKGELKMLFDIFMKAAEKLLARLPRTSFVLVKAPTLPLDFYRKLLSRYPIPVELVENDPYGAIGQSAVAVACSGTVTLECALLGTPMIICNRGTLLTYALAKLLLKVPYLGLPNLILGEGRIPELMQFDATPEKIAEAAERLLTDMAARRSMGADLREVSRRLGEPGASDRAAREVLNTLQLS